MKLILAIPLVVAVATLSACGSSGDAAGSKDYTSDNFSCVTTSPLKNGVTPGGTDLCLGTPATFLVRSLIKKAPGTVQVTVTNIEKGSAADLAGIAKQIPKDVKTSANDLYIVRETVTLAATDNPSAFKGDDPLILGIALQTDRGAAQGYIGIRTDSCQSAEFETGAVGDVYSHCDVLFADKGATPVSVTFTNTDGGGSFADNQVRWSTKK